MKDKFGDPPQYKEPNID